MFSVELTNYQIWQLESKGNILPDPEFTPQGDTFENAIDSLERMAEWMAAQAERELHEHEYQHTNQ
jgi:hypothetical protein